MSSFTDYNSDADSDPSCCGTHFAVEYSVWVWLNPAPLMGVGWFSEWELDTPIPWCQIQNTWWSNTSHVSDSACHYIIFTFYLYHPCPIIEFVIRFSLSLLSYPRVGVGSVCDQIICCTLFSTRTCWNASNNCVCAVPGRVLWKGLRYQTFRWVIVIFPTKGPTLLQYTLYSLSESIHFMLEHTDDQLKLWLFYFRMYTWWAALPSLGWYILQL